MPDEKEEVTAELVHRLGLDGIENLIYGDEPSSNLFTSLTVGAHLRFWPRWMDFYLGNTKRCKKQFPDEKALTAYYGASDTDGWLEEIRKNIRAALAEKPEYLVWHVADCTLEEAWTRQFYYTSKDVLRETAAIYNAVSEEVPETVEVLFENIFWPGLCRILPSEIDYFFSLLKGSNVGVYLCHGGKTGEHEKTVPRDAPVLFPVREVPEILYRRAAGEHGRRNRHDAYYLYRPAPSFHHGSGAENRGMHRACIPHA